MTRQVTAARLFVAAMTAAFLFAVPQMARAQDAAKLVARGQEVYNAQKCQVCHAISGKGNKANPLDGVGTKLTAADIRSWITDPKGMTAKTKSTKKPPMTAKYDKLPPADIDALVAYMQSLK